MHHLTSPGLAAAMMLFLLLAPGLNAVEISEDLEAALETLINDYTADCKRGRTWIYDQILNIPRGKFKFNAVIMHSPLLAYPEISLRCNIHNTQLRPAHWAAKKRPGCQPRVLYHVTGPVILLAQYYTCAAAGKKSRHKVLSTSICILQQLPAEVRRRLLFRLHHRCGWTVELANWVTAHITNGYSFASLHELLNQLGIENANFRSNMFESLIYPSPDLLIVVFLETFDYNKMEYECQMNQVVAKSMSLDHTFKISKNIGIKRKSDGAWVSQYKCAFVALNEEGQVLDWKFTKGEAFDHIKQSLINIRDRLVDASSPLDHIIVDNCCKLRNSLEEIFGPVPVKLDIFHAIQRVTRTVDRFDGQAQRLFDDLKLIVRSPADLGEVRCLETPAPEVIVDSIASLKNKWHKAEIYNKDTAHQLDLLKQHAEKGCLSYIPPSCGTNRNENLHKQLNRTLITHSATIGPELAAALLALLFYRMNMKKNQLPLNTNYDPLLVKPVEQQSTKEEISNEELNPVSEMSGQDRQTLSRILERTSKLVQNLKAISRSFDINKFLSCVFFCQGKLPQRDTQASVDTSVYSVVERNLQKLHKRRLRIAGDGDCLFNSIVCGLQSASIVVGSDLDIHFKSLDLPIQSSRYCIMRLRQLFVQHVQRNSDKYWRQTVLSKDDFSKDLEKFQSQGFYDSQIGDVVVEVLAEVLCCPLIVLTNIPSHEILPYFPNIVKSDLVSIFLVYSHEGTGHYDCALDISIGNQIPTPSKEKLGIPDTGRSRSRDMHSTYKYESSETFMMKQGMDIQIGRWTLSETVLLYVTIQVVEGSSRFRELSKEQVFSLFNRAIALFQNEETQSALTGLTKKTRNQIFSKISHLKAMRPPDLRQ